MDSMSDINMKKSLNIVLFLSVHSAVGKNSHYVGKVIIRCFYWNDYDDITLRAVKSHVLQ